MPWKDGVGDIPCQGFQYLTVLPQLVPHEPLGADTRLPGANNTQVDLSLLTLTLAGCHPVCYHFLAVWGTLAHIHTHST